MFMTQTRSVTLREFRNYGACGSNNDVTVNILCHIVRERACRIVRERGVMLEK